MIAGVCGVLRLDVNPVDLERFGQMKAHFGGSLPIDDWVGDWYAVARAGHNSTGYERACLLNEDGITVCFEGRIDNRRSLIRLLGLESKCSYSRLILRAYQKWNVALAEHILGAFIFAVIDNTSHQVLLSTDHLSLIPLYYYHNSTVFVFGSDIRQVIDGGKVSPVICRDKILEFLSPIQVIDEGLTDPESSFFSGIKILPYATSLLIHAGGQLEYSRYWTPPNRLLRDRRSPEDYAIEFREVFSEVVKDHLDTIHPIGADLSGGIDSGSLVFVAQNLLKRSGRSNHEFHTYTLSYNFKASQDDVRKVRHLLREHPTIVGHIIEADHLCGPLEAGELKAYRPTARPSVMNIPESYVALCRMARDNGCKLLLTGEGADYYLEGIDVIWDSAVKGGNWKLLKKALKVLRSRGSLPLLMNYLYNYAILPLMPFGISRRAYVRKYYEHTVISFFPDIFSAEFGSSLNSLLRSQRETLLKSDPLECWAQRLEHELLFPPNHVWQGLPVDIEVRHPYLDRRLLEFGLVVPPEFKFDISADRITHYGSRKVLQRKGLRGLVPPEILDSQVKATYGETMVQRQKIYLPMVFGDLKRSLVAEAGIIDANKFGEMIQNIASSDHFPVTYPTISWLDSILSLELWLRATVEEMPSTQIPHW